MRDGVGRCLFMAARRRDWEEKGRGVWLGARPSEGGEGGSGRCGALVREQGLGRHRQVGHSHSAERWHRLTGGPERHGTGRREFKSNSK
jgi:hypothetical protein